MFFILIFVLLLLLGLQGWLQLTPLLLLVLVVLLLGHGCLALGKHCTFPTMQPSSDSLTPASLLWLGACCPGHWRGLATSYPCMEGVHLRDGGQWPAGEIEELHSMAHTPDIEPGGTWRQVTELGCDVGGGGGCWPQAGSLAAAAPYLAPCADPRLVEGEWGR